MVDIIQKDDRPVTVEWVLGQSIRLSAPHLTDEQAEFLARVVIAEQEKLQPFLETMIPGSELQQKYGDWGIQLEGPDGGVGAIRGPKQAGESKHASAVLEHTQVLAVVTSPLVRGVLRAFGFKYHFIQAKSGSSQLIIH